MARTSITIVLELDDETDSPTGSAQLPDGMCREFHGWIGLTEAIDVLVRTNEGPITDHGDPFVPNASPSGLSTTHQQGGRP